MNTLALLATRLSVAEQQMRELSAELDVEEADRYAQGCADTYRELALLIRDEVARYQEQHV